MPASDFDFLIGTWDVEHDRLIDTLGPHDGPRLRFRTRVTVQHILGGLGTADETRGILPDGSDFAGFSLRLFDPTTDEWAIWWASTSRPGVLEEPVRGRFVDGRGEFVGHAEADGREFLSRFHWTGTASGHPVWEQEFSFDGGATWEPVNWRMVHTRVERPE